MRNVCMCEACRTGNNLGFEIDWGGLVTNTVKSLATVQQARSALVVQRAQHEAAMRAQQAEIQAMQRRQAQMSAQPAELSTNLRVPVPPKSAFADLPPWALPVGVGVLALAFLMRK